MYGDEMRAQGFVEVEIHLDYMSALANEVITDEVQLLWVLPIAPDRLLIKESSGFFDEYKLFFGDEIIVEQIGEKSYKLSERRQRSKPMALSPQMFFCSGCS